MAPKKPPSNASLPEPNAALSADRDDAERVRQAAEEALWVESAEDWLEEVDDMYKIEDEDDEEENEDAEAAEGDRDEVANPSPPDTHEVKTLKMVAELAQEELKDPESFPPLHPEYGIDVPTEGGLEWKCVYGRKGAKYEGTLDVYRNQQMLGMNQPEGGTPDSDSPFRVTNKYSSTLVYNLVSREYIQGRGVHQELLGDQYAGDWWGGLRQGHGTQTWINREHIETVDDVDLYQTDIDDEDTQEAAENMEESDQWWDKMHPFYTGKRTLAYLHDKAEEPGWIRPEDGELRGKHGAFPDVYQWTTADNLVGTYSGQWYRDTPEGCGVMVWSDGTSLAGEWRRGAYIGNFPVCTYQEADFHMRLAQLAAQKAKMFQYKPQDMTVVHEKPHLWQHPYFYDDGDQWRAPGPIHKFYEVPPEYRARVERMDAEREAWLDGWKNAGKEHPDWQQQWTAIEAVEQQQLVQVNFGEASPLMELAEQADKTDMDDVHEQLRLSAAARGAIIPSVRELRELAPGRQLGPGQLLMLLAQGKAPPLLMEDIEATVQFVDKYGEEGLIGVDDQTEDWRTQPMTVERARELLLEAIPETLLRESRQNYGAPKTLEPPPVNLLRLETQPMRAALDKDSPEYAQKVKERVLRRAEEALQELNDQLQAALRLKRLPGLPLALDDAQRDYLRKVKDEYQLRLNTIRQRRLRAVTVEEVPANEGNMGGLDLRDVERKARLEYLQTGRVMALLPGEEEVVGGEEPKGWQEKADRATMQTMAGREDEPESAVVLRGMPADELRRTQKHAQRFYNLELEATEKLLEFSRLLENYSRVPNDAPLENPSPARPPLLPAHPPGHISNPLPPVNTPAAAAEAIMSVASKAGHGPLRGASKFLGILPLGNWFRPTSSPTPVEAYAEYLEELPVRSKLEWTADAAPRVAVGPGGEVIEAEDNLEYQDSLERLRAERAQLAEDIRREQDELLAQEASTYVANVVDLARREAAELQATKLDSRFWGDQAEEDKKRPIQEWEPRPIGKTEEELAEESRSIRDEIQRRVEAARDAEEDAEFDATFTHEENQERLELREARERKKASLDPSARLDKLLAESTYSQPGALVELELAMEEAHVGAVLPVPAAPGAESYGERVEETFRELQEVELDRARDAAQKYKGRLTAEEGEEDEQDDDAAVAAEARAQIEGPEEEEDRVKRLERLEKKIMDLKWERVMKEDREASKAFELLGTTYEPLVLAHKRLISGLRNRELALDARLEAALTDFFAQYEAQYGPGEPEQARIFDTWLAKWVAAEQRLDAEPQRQLAARVQQPRPVRVDELLVQDQAMPPVLKGFLAKLADLEKQRDAEAERERQAWEQGRFPALPAPGEAPSPPLRQEVPALELHDGLDAVDIAQRRARELLAELQTERVEAEVTRQLRAEIAASDGGWDLNKAAKALRTLGSERRRKRAEEWDDVVRDAFENGNLDKYPLLVQLERAAQEELGLQGELPRAHILWAPLLRPPAPFSAAGLAGSPTLPLPFRIGKENLLARLRSDPESPLYDGSTPTDPIFKEGAAAWDLAADAYGGVHRPDSIVQVKDSRAVSGSTEWDIAEDNGVKWLSELQTSILGAEAPGWREKAAQAAQSAAPFSGTGAEAGLEVLAEHPLFDLQVKPADFKEQVAARLVVAQMTGRVFKMLGMELAPGTNQAEYVFAPKTRAPDGDTDTGDDATIWDDPDQPEWTPKLAITEGSDAVRRLVASQVKQLARSVPAPSELPLPGSSINFEAAVEQRKQQVLKNLVKRYQPRSYERLLPQLKDAPESWLPGENEFTATKAEVNSFLDSVREPKDLETTVASLRRVVAAQDEFTHIAERGSSLMTSAEQRFVKDFLVPKMAELSRLENKLWKEGLLLAKEQPDLVAFWKAEWDAREAFQRGVAAVMAQPAIKRAQEQHDETEAELALWHGRADKTLSDAAQRKADDRATRESRLSADEYTAPEVDYNGRPVLTGAPEEVGANPEEEWELAYEEMEQRDMNTAFYNRRDELDEKFFEDGLRKARDALRKLGGTAAFSEDLANFTRTLFKDDLELAKELLGPEDEPADGQKDDDEEYEEVEVEVEVDDDDDDEAYPQEEGDFWEAVRTQLQAISPADLDKREAEEKTRELSLRDVLPDALESEITAQVEAERPASKDKAVLWNMTEDDETKLDVFAVAPDGKFSKFDPQHRAFLPYADLDALVVNPAAVKPRPGSAEEEAIQAAEEQAKWAAEEERLKRGLDEVIPADALEVDQYGYAVVKSGVEEEEEDDRTTGQEWRRQPWYSNEPFFDFLEIPKAAPELTLDHEKEFLLQGVWAAAAKTPWIGDEGEITDPETKKERMDAAVAAKETKEMGVRRGKWASASNPNEDKLEYMLADDVDDVEEDVLKWVTVKGVENKSFLISRNADGELIIKDMPVPETDEEREERLKREAAEMMRKAQDDDADDEWRRLLKTDEEDSDAEYPPDGCFCPSPIGDDDDEDKDDALIEAEEEEEEEEDFVADDDPLGDDEDDEGDTGDGEAEDEDDLDAEDAAELQEVIRKINAGEFVPPRMPDFLRNLLKRKPAKPPPPPAPAQESGPGTTASLTLGALRVLPNYTDAVRWVSKMSAELQHRPARAAKKLSKHPKGSKRSKSASRGKRACPVDRGCFSLAVPLGKWTFPEGI